MGMVTITNNLGMVTATATMRMGTVTAITVVVFQKVTAAWKNILRMEEMTLLARGS